MASAKGARQAFVQGEKWLEEAMPKRFNELETGYNTARGDINTGMDAWRSLMPGYRGASDMYQNALGLNGEYGNIKARNAFQTGPGYQFAMDQGVQARERAASRMGGLASGGLLAELTGYGQGLANQEWGNWMNRLQPYDGYLQQGANQEANTGQGLAGLATNYYGNRSNIIGDTTDKKIGLFSAAMKAGDQAKAQNEANLIGGIMGGANLLGSLFGGGGGGLGSFAKFFGGK